VREGLVYRVCGLGKGLESVPRPHALPSYCVVSHPAAAQAICNSPLIPPRHAPAAKHKFSLFSFFESNFFDHFLTKPENFHDYFILRDL